MKFPRVQRGAVGESEVVDPLLITVGIVDGLIPSRTQMGAFPSSLGCTPVYWSAATRPFHANRDHIDNADTVFVTVYFTTTSTAVHGSRDLTW